jgi:hypothetical protein
MNTQSCSSAVLHIGTLVEGATVASLNIVPLGPEFGGRNTWKSQRYLG